MSATVDLNDLATFVRVADAGSFSGAARALGVPTSTVSRAVARLEDSLGIRLLQRTTRRVSLTREGGWLRQRSRGAIGSLENAAAAVRDLQGQPQGVLRVTAPQDLGHLLVADLVRRYSQRYPAVRVEVSLSARVVDLVGEGVDIALRAGNLRDSSLIARKLGDLSGYLVAAPTYVQARGAPRRLEELEEHECVLFRGRDGAATWRLSTEPASAKSAMSAKTGKAGRVSRKRSRSVTVRGRIDGDDYGFVRAMILAGGGVGVLPHVHCVDDLREGRLVHVLPEYVARGGALYVVYPTAKNLAAKVAAFRDLAIAEFQGV
ncbi:MAG: LysR family transcriptional regulator [Nannocystaceae bacterium]